MVAHLLLRALVVLVAASPASRSACHWSPAPAQGSSWVVGASPAAKAAQAQSSGLPPPPAPSPLPAAARAPRWPCSPGRRSPTPAATRWSRPPSPGSYTGPGRSQWVRQRRSHHLHDCGDLLLQALRLRRHNWKGASRRTPRSARRPLASSPSPPRAPAARRTELLERPPPSFLRPRRPMEASPQPSLERSWTRACSSARLPRAPRTAQSAASNARITAAPNEAMEATSR